MLKTKSSPSIFTDSFLEVDPNDINKAIRTEGFFAFESALTQEFIESIEKDVSKCSNNINNNWVNGVYINSQYYLTHMLATSRSFFDYVMHSKVSDVCDRLLGETYRLKAFRYYETFSGSQQTWHTDNKTDKAFANIPGIILISYISDVEKGEFQYIRGSQAWSGEKAYNEYDDDFINTNHKDNIVSFKMPKGSIIIYDTYGIHRARPVSSLGFVRKSLFVQVDNEIDSSEPILLNSRFLSELTEKQQTFLGFGKPAEYQTFPYTNYGHLPVLSKTGLELMRWLPTRLIRGVYQLIPNKAKVVIKKLFSR